MPAKPTTALRTTSGSARPSSTVRSPPTCLSGTSMWSSGDEPDATAQSSSSGCASTISIAWRPIEPVAPRRATRFMLFSVGLVPGTPPLGVPEGQHEVKGRRAREKQRVDPVEDAAVPAEERAGVLHVHVALQHRLEQVARGRRDDHDRTEDDRLPDHEVMVSIRIEGDEGDEDAGDRADHEALDRLPR